MVVNLTEVKDAGKLGYLGSILLFIPFADVAGIVLVTLALRRLSRAYGNNAIGKNATYALVSTIASIGAFSAVFLGINSNVGGLIFAFALLPAVGLLVGGYWFMTNAYDELAESSEVNEFNKAAHWYYIGAVLLFFLIGVIFLIIANIYALLGFRRLKNMQ